MNPKGAIGLVVLLAACGHSRPFEPVEWRAASNHGGEGNPTVRQRMVRDVMEKVLPGKTREEIVGVLGPSLDTDYFKSTGRDLIYILGPERGSLFGLDSEWLLIWLDEKERFRRAELATD